MATKLKNLVITKVALVDEGSCSAAHIKLFKRKEGGVKIMGIEDILKLIPEDQREEARKVIEKAKTDASTAASQKTKTDMEAAMDGSLDAAMSNPKEAPKNDTAKKTVAKVATKIQELNDTIEKLRNPETKTEDEILKGLDPAVRAVIEKSRAQAAAAEAAVKKMRDDADQAEAISKAKELTHLSAKEEDLAKSFKILKQLNGEVYEDVFSVLKAADAMIADGNPLGTNGTSGNEGIDDIAKAATDAWAKVEAKAEEIKKARNITKEAAVCAVMNEEPDLYRAYVNTLK